jgi:hypothetical protein
MVIITELEKSILNKLVELEEAVKSLRTSSPKPNLAPILLHLDRLTSELPGDTDPNLLHYMNKKSYQKAMLFLQGRESENTRTNGRHV